MLHFKDKIILIGWYFDHIERTGADDNALSFIDYLISIGALNESRIREIKATKDFHAVADR